MQRLESFFIDIIRQAQRQKRPTSGAINRMDATAAERTAAVANVLDRLVAAKVEPDKLTKPPKTVETIELKPDKNILSRLTEDEQQDSAPPPQTTKQQVDEQDRGDVEKGVLDELVAGQDSAEQQESDDNGSTSSPQADRQPGDDKNG
jgi:hypothetical protein